MNWLTFSKTLSKQLNQNILIQTAHPVSGGDIHQSFQLHTNQGNLFLKLNQAHLLPLFETEAHNLNAIQQSLSLRCPKVLGYGLFENASSHQAWLLMEYLDLTSQGDDYQRGKDLALMHHQIHKATQPFGWFENNYIGHTIQPNQWHSNWINFYGQQRLKPQLELAQLRDANPELFVQGQKLIEALPFWFKTYQPQASLLHGDLWAGNSAFIKDGTPVIFDPACYYGDRETDLAMTELFGGFSPAFYAGYNEVFPLDAGYAQRKPLYNLYHIINHYNLFGGHYEQQALQLVTALLKQSQN